MIAHTGIRAQVANAEAASAEATHKVEAPVGVVTGASRGIAKAIALFLGKAGCKVSEVPLFQSSSLWCFS